MYYEVHCEPCTCSLLCMVHYIKQYVTMQHMNRCSTRPWTAILKKRKAMWGLHDPGHYRPVSASLVSLVYKYALSLSSRKHLPGNWGILKNKRPYSKIVKTKVQLFSEVKLLQPKSYWPLESYASTCDAERTANRTISLTKRLN